MRKQIGYISVHQTSKVIAAMHTVMVTVLFILPIVLGYFFHRHVISGLFMLIVVPLLIWVFLYIGYVIACWFYNLVIPWTGGIEFDLVEAQKELPVRKISLPEEDATSTAIANQNSETGS